MNEIKEALKRFAVWAYNWITVIVGVVAGALAFVPDLISQTFVFLDMVGVSTVLDPFSISPVTAAKITSCVALAKGIFAWWQSRQ